MKLLIQIKPTISSVLTGFALLCFAVLPQVQAVVPPPDGGYPNFTTAEGQKALFNLTTGAGNTAVGWFSLWGDTDGSFNTGLGAGALALNDGDSNTAIGAAALLLNTAGHNNVAVGTSALGFNTEGLHNVAVGTQALSSNTTGNANTAIGYQALLSNVASGSNTAVGWVALLSNTEGINNTATGASALSSNTTGRGNTAYGSQTASSNTTGDENTAIGTLALFSNTEGSGNVATGYQALFNNTADGNTAYGYHALMSNTAGRFNTATGYQALRDNMTADLNTAIGYQALANNTIGEGNTAIGVRALAGSDGNGNTALGDAAGFNLATGDFNIYIDNAGRASESNTIRIGSFKNSRTFIAGIRGVTTENNNAVNVVIDSDGQLGTISSSRRFKDEIKPMGKSSETIHALKPVMFHYKSDKTATPQFGLIAEEVAEVNPDIVVRDANGEIYTVRYDAVNAMLLNEFLKEHKKVQQQEATIAQLKSTLAKKEMIDANQQKQIDALSAGLQKVSAQLAAASPSDGGLELNKRKLRTALNSP